jgi:dipeptidyl aminopeptidase/acylaminoacyl peptidase
MRRAVAAVACVVTCAAVRVSTETRAIDLDDLARLVRVTDPQISPDGRAIVVVVGRANLEDDRWDTQLELVDAATGATRPLTVDRRGAGHPRWSPDGTRLAFIARVGAGSDVRPQIFVLPMNGGEAQQLTKASAGVQQFAWSPDGASLAFATADEREKKTGPEKHNDAFEVANDDLYVSEAPMPTHVWIVPSGGGAARRVTSGSWTMPVSFPPGPPSSPFAWSPDGKSLAVAKVASTHSGDSPATTVALVDVASGAMRQLTSATRLEGYPIFSPDGTSIAYWYSRDGDPTSVNDLYIAPVGGGAPRNVTRGIDRNFYRAAWTPDGQSLILGANDVARTSLWVQPISGPARRLDLGNVSVATSFWVEMTVGARGAIAFVGSEPQHPAELYYMAEPGATPKRLTSFNSEVAGRRLGRVEMVEWTSDGLAHNGVLTYPPDFDPSRKYPLVLIIHGGPTAASLLGFGAQAHLTAARGWIVFQPNYRGSDQRGNAYVRSIFGDAGDGPGRDVMAGVAAVKKLGFVDESRIAVTGWSYGGYMTSWLIGHYSGWRVAMAGAPVTDFLDQYSFSDGNIGFGDFFGGSPWTGNRMEAYRAQSPITYASKIRTPTLIMSDTGDSRVPMTQAFKLYHALVDNGVETKFVAFPVPGHSPGDPIRQRDMYRRWIEWIEQHFAARSTSQ